MVNKNKSIPIKKKIMTLQLINIFIEVRLRVVI